MEERDLTWNIWAEGCPNGEYVLSSFFVQSQADPVRRIGRLTGTFCSWSRSPQQVSDRLDELIGEIKSIIEANSSSWPSGQVVSQRGHQAQDIVCVAHGHVLAALARRWVGLPLQFTAARMVFEPASVTALGYVDSQLLLCFDSALCTLFCVRYGYANLMAGRFEHDNINQPAIMLGWKPSKADWTV